MKLFYSLLLVGLAATPQLVQAQSVPEPAADYQLLINGKSYPLTPGQQLQHKTAGGETVMLELRESEFRTFRDKWVSFQTPRNITASETASEDGVRHVVVMNTKGSGMIVQEFELVNPTAIIDFMLNELSKDEVAIGGKRQDKPYSLRLADGKVLTGKTAEIKHKKSTRLFHVVSWSGDDEGLLVVLMDVKDGSEDDASNKKFLDDITGTLHIVQ